MSDLGRAREVLELLEAGDVDAITERFSERLRGFLAQGWKFDDYLRDLWRPAMDDLAGPSRRIVGVGQVSSTLIRFTVEGDKGTALVSIRLDESGAPDGFAIDREIYDGIANLVITCPDDRIPEVKGMYDALLGEDQWRVPLFVYDEGRDYHPPVWGDPQRPQQIHLDIRVPDLDAAGAIVLEHGATLRHDAGTHRVYTDPIDHPFCLIPVPDRPVELWRIVIDCPDARELASFYAEFLDLPELTYESPSAVAIGRADGRLPELGFREVSPYVPPRWPDPAHGAQMHFDIRFDDAMAARAKAERLGAVLQPRGGSCPVYADPVGHPFCLCMYGQ